MKSFGFSPGFRSGHVVLEFTNTVSNHASQRPGESLFGYADLIRWGKKTGLLGDDQVRALLRKARAQTGTARRLFAQSLKLREALYRIFVALATDRSPADADLVLLNDQLRPATQRARLARAADGYAWQWNVNASALDAPLRLIALAAVDLLTSEHARRVGQCADANGCGWLFADTSKNHSRRWCDINDCGNRAKQRRYQARKHR